MALQRKLVFNIRNYTQKDYIMLKGWWEMSGEVGPELESLPENTTYILEYEGSPLLSITIYLTNCKNLALLENFIGNPAFAGQLRKDMSQKLVDYCYAQCKQAGYKTLLCFSLNNEKIINRYQELGMTKVVDHLVSFGRKL